MGTAEQAPMAACSVGGLMTGGGNWSFFKKINKFKMLFWLLKGKKPR
jgi:hypothetical protein